MSKEQLRKIIETAVRAGVRLGVASVGETRSLGARSTFTETRVTVEQVDALVDAAVAKVA